MARALARTTGSPGLRAAEAGYGTHVLGGKLWRIYVLEQGGIRIATADRIDVREALLRDIALSAGVPFVVALSGSLLLLWFGIGRGLLPLERVRAALARRAIEDVQAPGDDPGRVSVEAVDSPLELRMPEALAVSALRNLIDNALRYSPSTCWVTLTVEWRDEKWVCFTVLDEGPGLTEAECAQSLERFWRRGSGVQGSGLGLPIASASAMRYGGRLQLSPRGEAGLKAELCLPGALPRDPAALRA